MDSECGIAVDEKLELAKLMLLPVLFGAVVDFLAPCNNNGASFSLVRKGCAEAGVGHTIFAEY